MDEIVDLENKDTFDGVEAEFIKGLVYHLTNQYKDQQTRLDKINNIKLFDSFKEPLKVYIKLRDQFQIIG